MELRSEYMLLCAPYRFKQHHLTKLPPRVIAKDLLSLTIPSVATQGIDPVLHELTKQMPVDGFDVTDAKSALRTIEELHSRFPAQTRGWADFSTRPEEKYFSGFDAAGRQTDPEHLGLSSWNAPPWFKAVADNRGPQGVNDASLILFVSAAYSAGLLEGETAWKIVERCGRRAAASYTGWEQYLASCALGSIAFQKALSTDPEQPLADVKLISAIHGLSISAAPIFEAATFWPPPDLSWLADNLEPLLPKEQVAEQKMYVNASHPAASSPSQTPPFDDLSERAQQVLSDNSVGELEYDLCCSVSHNIWAEPARLNGLGFLLLDSPGQIHLPNARSTTDGQSSFEVSEGFWQAYNRAQSPDIDGVPFAWISRPGSASFLLTSSCVYRYPDAAVQPVPFSSSNQHESDLGPSAAKSDRTKPQSGPSAAKSNRAQSQSGPPASESDRTESIAPQPIPWDQIEFRCRSTQLNDIAILINGEKVCEIAVDYEALGLPRSYHEKNKEIVGAVLGPHIARLETFLNELSWQVMDWQLREE